MMRVVLMLLLIATLSGCTSSGDGLQPYLMSPAELPSGCSLADITKGEAAEAAESLDMQSNPGSINSTVFRANGIEPIANRVAFYACGEPGRPEFVSAAQRFASAEAATEWIQNRIQCDASPTFQDGAVVGAIEPWDGSWQLEHLDAARAAFDRIVAATGAIDVCPNTH